MTTVTRSARLSHKLVPDSQAVGSLLGLALFFVVWLVAVPLLPTNMIPSLPELIRFVWDELRGVTVAPHTIWSAFGTSLARLGAGLVVAMVLGVILGLVQGASRLAQIALHDFLVVGLSVPTLVWALVTGIWFGPGTLAPLVTVVLAATPFVALNIAEGVRNVPRDLLEMAAVYRATRTATLRSVMAPSLAPFAFGAFRYALSAGWKALVIAEVFAASSGAGWTIQFWRDARRPQGVFGYAVFFVLFAILLEKLAIERLARRVFAWRDINVRHRDVPEGQK